MTKLSEIISKLCKFYWSEEPPENYVLNNGAGLGRIAKQDYAAFNLAWKFSNGALQTFDEHKAAVVVFVAIQKSGILDRPVEDGNQLRDLVTLNSASSFESWYVSYKHKLDDEVTGFIDFALRFKNDKPEAVRNLQGI